MTSTQTAGPPPVPMIYANGNSLARNGSPVPIGSVLKARIDDYLSEDSATIEDGGAFDFLKITPPDDSYVGKTLIFQLEVADEGTVDADEQEVFQPRKTEFGKQLTFDVATTGPAPAPPAPPSDDDSLPGPPPFPMIFAQGFAYNEQGDPVPRDSVLRGRIDDYISEDSERIENGGYFDFLKITPPGESYVGKTLTFQLMTPDNNAVDSNEMFTFQPQGTEFNTNLTFNVGASPPPPPSESKGFFARLIDAILRLFGIRR